MDVALKMSTFMSSRSTHLTSSSARTTCKNFLHKKKGGSTVYLRTHSQMERRRRDKMNSLIHELASLVNTCNTTSHTLDKLSVLRMAVQHMRTLQGFSGSTDVYYKPAFLSDEELKYLLERAADGFLFVVDCNWGEILFVSESVCKILNYSQKDLIGQSLFDYLHPKDAAKVKEQLSSAMTRPQGDTKSGSFVRTEINPSTVKLSSGVRRSFFCRMKCNRNVEDEDLSSSCLKKNDHKGFCTIHCTGYLKYFSPTEVNLVKNNELDNDGYNLCCLVAVGRLHSNTVPQPVQNDIKVKPMEFVSRHANDGKFVFVDQRATAILAYLPQELLGTSFYEYFHEDDIAHLAECHRKVLQMREIDTNCYKLKIKDGSFITLRSRWFSFMNPWTKEMEYIVSTNTVVIPLGDRPESSYHQPAGSPHTAATSLMPVTSKEKPHLQTVPALPGATRAGAGKIGQMIAEDMLKIQSERLDVCTVISEEVFEKAASSAALKNRVVGRVENMARERKRGNQAHDISTASDVKEVSEALGRQGCTRGLC